MNPGEIALRRRSITVFITVLILVAGWLAYEDIARLEDPEFTIRQANLVIPYPGATAAEVAEEVTEVIESAVQELGYFERIKSVSEPGRSTVSVETYYEHREELAAIWSRLRSKLRDTEAKLPPGAGPVMVFDDFGDTYGILLALTGPEFSPAELETVAKQLQRALAGVEQVSKVAIDGVQREVIELEITRERLLQLGGTLQILLNALQAHNTVAEAGSLVMEGERIRIRPATLDRNGLEELRDLLITDPESGTSFLLRDVATLRRTYEEPPTRTLYWKGQPALHLGISAQSGANVVKLGAAVRAKLDTLRPLIPLGMTLEPVYFQADGVEASVEGFVINVLAALAIVVGVLLVAMGWRSGLIIGILLIVIVAGTLILMNVYGIALQRISLGALIIALGMLVDNAIVITEGIQVRVERGVERFRAASESVRDTLWPLLGATVIGVLAFAGIGLSPDNTGEYAGSLFWVILISLLLSWVFGVTLTPVLCVALLKPGQPGAADPYAGRFYRAFRALLAACLRRRWITIAVAVAAFAGAVVGFGWVRQSFFPASQIDHFIVDLEFPSGTDLRTTEAAVRDLDEQISQLPGVRAISASVGGGVLRYMLVYPPPDTRASIGQLQVHVDTFRQIDPLLPQVEELVRTRHPQAWVKAWKIMLGPGGGAQLETRISGPDPAMLRRLAEEVLAVYRADANTQRHRHDWRHQIKVATPLYDASQARLSGVTRQDLQAALAADFGGVNVGLHREGDKLIPIRLTRAERERSDAGQLREVLVWSTSRQRYIPIDDVTTGVATTFQDPQIRKRDRLYTLTVQADTRDDDTFGTFARLRPQLEALTLPPGYHLEWGGLHESSTKANGGVMSTMPLAFLAMFVITVVLFNGFRQAAVIWFCVPLAFIGVTLGLLLTGTEFGFMAMLGFLSLSGMLIKNAIVLVEQIDLERAAGKSGGEAILDSGVSRLRPVAMAALTTILGMIPLLGDVFFRGMAVVIMFGLLVATALTLLVAPAMYAVLFRLPTATVRP
jgi:multidrug efflux pump subunit AcrB